MKKAFLITVGWISIALAIIGVVLPILPTTPFLVLATAAFAKSSPRFHQMLLSNRWFGADLRRWDEERVVERETKYKATILIFITFSISIHVLYEKLPLQLMLVGIGAIALFFIWRLREPGYDTNEDAIIPIEHPEESE